MKPRDPPNVACPSCFRSRLRSSKGTEKGGPREKVIRDHQQNCRQSNSQSNAASFFWQPKQFSNMIVSELTTTHRSRSMEANICTMSKNDDGDGGGRCAAKPFSTTVETKPVIMVKRRQRRLQFSFAASRQTIAPPFVFVLLSFAFLLFHHHLAPCALAVTSSPPSSPLSSPPPPSPLQSQAAIVRRLYYSSSSSSSASTSSSSSSTSSRLPSSSSSSPSSPHRATYNSGSAGLAKQHPLLLNSRGVAKVTPISLHQMPTFNVRLGSSSSSPSSGSSQFPKNHNSSIPLPISTVSASIPVVSAGAVDSSSSSGILSPSPSSSSVNVLAPPSTSTSTLTTTTTTTTTTSTKRPSTLSHRQGKSVVDLEPPPSRKSEEEVEAPIEESNLCFLSHGGSSETFTVNEAMPVDSVIGTIKVIGNASAHGGNIELSIIGPSDSAGAIFTSSKSSSTSSTYYSPTSSSSSSSSESSSSRETFGRRLDSGNETTENPILSEPTIPIRIDPGTKRLVLARKLDKESAEGESGLTIGVRCRPVRRNRLRNSDLPNSRLRKNSFFNEDEHDNETDSTNDVLNDVHSGSASSKKSSKISSSDSSSNSYWIYDTSSSESSGSSNPDDDIIIPIRILVTDANDNRPEWTGLPVPFILNISESTAVGSVVASGLRALDADQQGPYSTVEYYIEPTGGAHAHLLRFSSPLEGTLVLAAPLDYEALPNFTITLRAQDQGVPPNWATTEVEVRVLDADDQNPRFEVDKYTTVLAEGQRSGDQLVVSPRAIKAEDPDRAINSPIVYGFNSRDSSSDDGHGSSSSVNNLEYSYFAINPNTGAISLKRPLPSSVPLPVTLVIRATQLDNRDRYALTTLTVLSRRNQMLMPELRFLHLNYSTSLLESTPPGHVVLTAQTSRIINENAGQNAGPLRFTILDDEEGHFSVRGSGEVLVKKPLDYEKHRKLSFRVMVTDGRQSDVARITVTVLNVNEHDPVFSQGSYLFHVSEARLRGSPVIGAIRATDADDGDKVQISLAGPHAAAFALSALDGTLRLRSLRLVNSTECHLIATATDSGSPPRSSSASVVVKFSPALLKSFNLGRNVKSGGDPLAKSTSFLTDWEDDLSDNDLASSGSSPSAADILQQGAHSLFSASANSTALVLVIVLGVLLGTLFIIIVALTIHVLKNRKYDRGNNGRSGSPNATAALHLPGGGSSGNGESSAASTTSSSSSSSSSSSLSISSPTDMANHYHLADHHHHHLHGHGAFSHHPHHPHHPPPQQPPRVQHYHQKQQPVQLAKSSAPSLNGSRNSSLFFTGLRLNANKVSPSELTSVTGNGSSPDTDNTGNYDDTLDEYQLHLHHHHHLQQQQQQNDPLKGFTRKTFMDSASSSDLHQVTGEHTKSIHHLHQHSSAEMDSAISSDLSTGSDIGSGGGGGQGSKSGDHQADSAASSRSSSADLVIRNSGNQNSSSSSSPPDTGHSNNSNSTTNVTVGSRISVIKWPQGSIPRRVKKLTWQDEQRNNHLDQMYTSNSTVTAPANSSTGVSANSTSSAAVANLPTTGLAAKTKTLSGHLLTGNGGGGGSNSSKMTTITTTTTSPKSPPPAIAPKPGNGGNGGGSSKTFGQFMPPRVDASSDQGDNYSNHHLHHHHVYSHPHVPNHLSSQSSHQTSAAAGNLPDLTVYF